MLPAALTNKAIDAAKPGDVLWDATVKGLHLRAFPQRKTFYLYYRTRAGRQRKPKLGDTSTMTLAQAREMARSWLRAVADGRDPAGEMKASDERPTMRELAKKFMEEHAATKKKPRSQLNDRIMWEKHVLPRMGDLIVADVTTADVEALHHAMRATPIAANRTVAMLHKAFNLARRWKMYRGDNPAVVERYKERQRKRHPGADEAIRMFRAWDAMRPHNPHFVGLVELLALTGCRKNEIMAARREWVKEDGLHLPDSKTGDKVVALSSYAREVIDELPVLMGNPYLIPGRKEKRPMTDVRKSWRALLKAAKIEGLWMHDLRRFFASAGLSTGLTLEAVGQLLGHANLQTTKRYAFLLHDARQQAAEQAGEAIRRRLVGRRGVRLILAGDGRVVRAIVIRSGTPAPERSDGRSRSRPSPAPRRAAAPRFRRQAAAGTPGNSSPAPGRRR